MSSMRRRSILKGLGVCAGASFLGPLVSRLVSADTPPVCRFVFVVDGNGFDASTLLTDSARAALDATMSAPLGASRAWSRSYRHASPLVVPATDLATASALGSLAADGAVAAQTSVIYGLSSKVAGGGHSGMHGVLASARSVGGSPGGPTIDAHLAGLSAVRATTPRATLRLGADTSGEPLNFGLCATQRDRAAPVMLQPGSAFDSLFGVVGDDASMAAFARRRDLLSFARADANAALATFPGNSRERRKLETYLASIEELSRRDERLVELAPSLVSVRPPGPGEDTDYASNDPLVRFEVQMRLATAALLGELTHVAVVGLGTGGAFGITCPSVINVDRHQLQHEGGEEPTYVDALHEITRRQVAAIGEMASTLAATPEVGADGSMLDHTVIVFISDNGEQHHSRAEEFPTLLVGGSALGLAGGQTVAFPGRGAETAHRQVSNLWNTLGHLAGEDLNEFGEEGITRIAAGPLAELMS
ncbi:MAG: DUF1552 domain-containing protein [Deltaproteobacteria bacterium]|nr:DUF1552 domain-containing protein [Deltaproteobacteria bacterium]